MHASIFWHAVTCTPACRNGGTCHTTSFSAHCDCPSGYTGSYCQTRGRYDRGHSCEQQLDHESHHECIACFWHAVTCTPACRNGGTCHTNSYSAHCDCPSGYTGSYCQTRGKYNQEHSCEQQLNASLVVSSDVHPSLSEWKNMS